MEKVFLAIVLAVSLAPTVPQAAVADDSEIEALQPSIQSLLAAGDYKEGEALALAREGAGPQTQGESDAIAVVGADSVELATGQPGETS